MRLPDKNNYSSEMGNNFHPATPKTPPTSQNPPLRACSATRDSSSEFRLTIASYRRYCCLCSLNRSLRLLSPLVFIVTAFGISLFQGPERQYQSLEKVPVSKIFQGMAPHPQNSKLNDSLAWLVRLRPLRSTKNSEPFSNSYFAPCNIIINENFVTYVMFSPFIL